MNTVIVPVDFSETSSNAAVYAAKMLKGVYDANLILYHMYEKSSEESSANEQLNALKARLAETNAVKTETIAVEGSDLIDEIDRVVRHRHASLVIMGITGRTALEKVFMGSNTLKLVDKNICPVLIIPPDAKFNGVKNVALTSDFQEVRLTTPSVPIKAILEMFHPSLHVVNVDNQHYVSLTAEYQKERSVMQEMFSNFNPEFYFIGMNDFFEAIEQFITDKKIDILITIPRRHSFLGNVFKSSHTKKLVYHSHVPILAVHE
jgi:nucleotide-binding universal stress UspA family protein